MANVELFILKWIWYLLRSFPPALVVDVNWSQRTADLPFPIKVHLTVEERWLDQLSIREPVHVHIWRSDDVTLKHGRLSSPCWHVVDLSGDFQWCLGCNFVNTKTVTHHFSMTWITCRVEILHNAPVTSTLNSACLLPYSLMILHM